MPAPFRRLTLAEFGDLLLRFPWTREIREVHLHHTWSPARADWRGLPSVVAMRDYHVHERGWSDIAQHLTIDPGGGCWTGRDWNRAPASSEGHNGSADAGPFMCETVGNFDAGHDRLDGPQYAAVLGVIARVQLAHGLAPETLRFHRQLGSPKTCPGSGVDYAATLAAVRTEHARLAAWPPALA